MGKDLNTNKKKSNLIRPNLPDGVQQKHEFGEYCVDCDGRWFPRGHWSEHHRAHYCEACDFYTRKDERFESHLNTKTHQKNKNKMSNTVTFSKTTIRTYDFTYANFCAMDNYKNLSDDKKLEAWQKLVKMSERGEIDLDKCFTSRGWLPHEEVKWNEDEQQDIINFIQKSIG